MEVSRREGSGFLTKLFNDLGHRRGLKNGGKVYWFSFIRIRGVGRFVTTKNTKNLMSRTVMIWERAVDV